MSESIHGPVCISLSGSTAIHEATLAARNFAKGGGISEADAARLAITVEELVTNLYDHGGLGVRDAFEIELSATDANIRLVIIDPARPFDSGFASLDRHIPARGGGAGLKLVRAWAKRTDYQSADGLNRLTVLLPRKRRGG